MTQLLTIFLFFLGRLSRITRVKIQCNSRVNSECKSTPCAINPYARTATGEGASYRKRISTDGRINSDDHTNVSFIRLAAIHSIVKSLGSNLIFVVFPIIAMLGPSIL